MEFSVLMSVYAKENAAFLDIALSSNLIKQTQIPNELILVCDGPLTEELEAVIDRYLAKFPEIMKVFRLDKNVGLGNALNYGLEKCRYDWVARADSDDVCHPQRFEIQTRFLAQNPSVDIVGSNIAEFQDDWEKPHRAKQMPQAHKEIVRTAKFRNPINHMTVMFKKSVIQSVGSYQHLLLMEDYYLWVRAIANGAVAQNIEQILVYARVGNGMEQRRGNRAQISSRKKLNHYMLRHGMINIFDAAISMIGVIGFTCCPNVVRKFLYNKILRKTTNV